MRPNPGREHALSPFAQNASTVFVSEPSSRFETLRQLQDSQRREFRPRNTSSTPMEFANPVSVSNTRPSTRFQVTNAIFNSDRSGITMDLPPPIRTSRPADQLRAKTTPKTQHNTKRLSNDVELDYQPIVRLRIQLQPEPQSQPKQKSQSKPQS